MHFSAWLIPLLITGLFGWGLCAGVDVFDCFLRGAREGLKTAAAITPALVCLLTVVTMFRAGGALELLTGLLRPLASAVGFPAEVLPLALLRPVSGSGGTALLHQLLGQYGPDSFIGRVGSVLAAASETTFYAIAVSVCDIVKTLLNGSDTILCVSSMMHGEFGIEDVCLSIPTIVNGEGIKGTLLPELTEDEVEKLRHSADVLKQVIAQIDFGQQ